MEKETLRGAFSKKILEEAKKDKDIIVVATDSRGSAQLGAFPEELPDQFVEMGIAEQNAVTVSAGMASAGKKVYAIGPASFYSMRSAEQVKVDVAYSHNNVKIIGISGGLSYGALGATHHSLQDIATMRSIPDLIVELPSDANQMRKITEKMLSTDDPAYIRVGRGAVPLIYDAEQDFALGKAVKWFDGKDAAVIACGQMVYRALGAAEILRKAGINVTVLDMHTIKPLDVNAIVEVSNECGCILTVEEASIYGGLGGAVAEVVAQNKLVPVSIAGIPDENVPNGNDSDVFAYYHLDENGIADRVIELIKRKNK